MSSKNQTESGTIAVEMVLPAIGEPETLVLRRRALPAPRKGEVIVRVEATGVSFAEKSMRRGRYPGQPAFPFVPGYDVVGVIAQRGPGEFELGQRVAAVTKAGGWTDHIVLAAKDLVVVPEGLSAVDAETAVVNGVTAWQMLYDVARIRQGQTILVHGATSGVGVLLVQLARLAGLRVLGTASPAKHDALRALGAEPLDYHADVEAVVKAMAPGGVDAVFDHLGGPSLDSSWRLLGPGGVLVSYALATKLDETDSLLLAFLAHLTKVMWWNALPNGRRAHFYNMWSGKTTQPRAFQKKLRDAIGQVFALLADGRIEARVGGILPLERAAEALRLAESGTVVGKVVIVPGRL